METVRELKSRHRLKIRLAWEGLLVGILAGLTIVLFRLGVEGIQHGIQPFLSWAGTGGVRLLAAVILYLFLALVAGLLVRWEPMISGSGIPQVSGRLTGQLHFSWYRVLVGKILGGLTCLGAGLTLGREGPSVQMGACCGEVVSVLLKRPRTEKRFLLSAGAASGVAAAFSAPISGIVFALEEVHRNFSALAMISAMTGAVTADFICKTVFGLKPELAIQITQRLPLRQFPLLLLLGLVVGLGACTFNRCILWGRAAYERLPLPKVLRPILPFGLTLACVLWIGSDLFGSGQKWIYWAQEPDRSLGVLVGLGLLKAALLFLAFCAGLPGGIFFPLLVLGSLVGQIFGVVCMQLGWIEPEQILFLSVLAMAGHFSGIVRAPVTGILLICEMTGSFSSLLALTLVSGVAYLTAERLGVDPIYESLLRLIAPVSEEPEEEEHSGARVLIEFAVLHESQAAGSLIRELKWPEQALLVSVKRGGREILPKGYIRLRGGDYLVVLLPESAQASVGVRLQELCGGEASHL